MITQKIFAALKAGRLSPSELSLARRWIEDSASRSAVIASGTSSALAIAGVSQGDSMRLRNLVEKARDNAAEGRAPFSGAELDEVERILKKTLETQAARRIARGMANSDEMVLHAVSDSLKRISFTVSLAPAVVKRQ